MPNSIESIIANIKDHQEEIEILKEGCEKNAKGIDNLYLWKKEVERWRQESDESFKDLKLTIMQENKETRSFFQTMMNNQWDLIKSATNQRYEAEKQAANNTFEIKKTEADIKRENAKQMWALIGKLFAGGGVGAAVILGIMSLFGITL